MASRFFGDPFVPASLADKFDEDFIFLAQIRLADLAELDTANALPHNGYLYLFIDAEMYPSDELYIFCEHANEVPDTLLSGFNSRSPVKIGLDKGWDVRFEKAHAEYSGTKLLGSSADGNHKNVLLQYCPSELVDIPFLNELDGYLYLLFGDDGFNDAEYIVEGGKSENVKSVMLKYGTDDEKNRLFDELEACTDDLYMASYYVGKLLKLCPDDAPEHLRIYNYLLDLKLRRAQINKLSTYDFINLADEVMEGAELNRKKDNCRSVRYLEAAARYLKIFIICLKDAYSDMLEEVRKCGFSYGIRPDEYFEKLEETEVKLKRCSELYLELTGRELQAV